MKTTRRKHSKISSFPPEIVDVVNRLLTEGRTYADIVDWLKNMGYSVSVSSTGRYSQDFMNKLEYIKQIKDQARAIVEDTPDRPATEIAEAAGQFAISLIMEALMAAKDENNKDVLSKKMIEAMKALSQLERSAVAREKLKFDVSKGVDGAMARLKEQLKQELNKDPAILEQIFNVVDRISDQTKALS